MAWRCVSVISLLGLATGVAVADLPWGAEARLWRNVMDAPDGYDAGMAAIDAMVDPAELPESARHVRALISRFDAVDHYRAPDNLALIVRAIGAGTYPGYPAVDVLARRDRIDAERREWFAAWARSLSAWSRGETVSGRLELGVESVDVDQLLGGRTRAKEWLAASLARTLESFVPTPAERLAGLDDETFVRAVYRAALGRGPSPDDLRFRLAELKGGKGREAFVEEIHRSDEARQRRLCQVLQQADQVEPPH